MENCIFQSEIFSLLSCWNPMHTRKGKKSWTKCKRQKIENGRWRRRITRQWGMISCDIIIPNEWFLRYKEMFRDYSTFLTFCWSQSKEICKWSTLKIWYFNELDWTLVSINIFDVNLVLLKDGMAPVNNIKTLCWAVLI